MHAFILLVAIMAVGGKVFAAVDLPPQCKQLGGTKLSLAKEIMAKNYPYDCCDETISKCLKKEKVCKLAVRLAVEICSRVAKGQNKEEIELALRRRAKSMMEGSKKANIDTSSLDTWAGVPESKVVLVAYLCARCPMCAKVTPKLYKSVTEGRLKGKVRLHVRNFPLKGHKGTAPAALALVAAAKMGKFWPYLLHIYEKINEFHVEKLAVWAKEKGLDKEKYDAITAKEETRKLVEDSKKEGIRNGVESTPTFFINGKKYVADLDIEYLIDALEEEYDRVTGQIYVQ